MLTNMTYLTVSKSWTCQICDMKSLNGWTLIVLNSFNGWTQIIRQISQNNFGKQLFWDNLMEGKYWPFSLVSFVRIFVGKRLYHAVQWATVEQVNIDPTLCLLQLTEATFPFKSSSWTKYGVKWKGDRTVNTKYKNSITVLQCSNLVLALIVLGPFHKFLQNE